MAGALYRDTLHPLCANNTNCETEKRGRVGTPTDKCSRTVSMVTSYKVSGYTIHPEILVK